MPATAEQHLHRFTVDDYHALNKAGVLHAGVELLDGVVYHQESAHRGPEPFRYTVEDFYQMYEADILPPDKRFELIDGAIIEMAPIGYGHAAVVDRLTEMFVQRLAGRAIVRVQNPINLATNWLPQPDLALLRPREDYYGLAHPTAGDAFWLIEVAESTLERDRDEKAPMYASFGVPELWIIDIPGRSVETFRRPANGRYTESHPHPPDAEIHPAAFPDEPFPVRDLLGR